MKYVQNMPKPFGKNVSKIWTDLPKWLNSLDSFYFTHTTGVPKSGKIQAGCVGMGGLQY